MAYDFQPIERPSNSPWGGVDCGEQIAPGIWTVSTPSHGGILLSEQRWRFMAPALRVNPYGGGRWFEEDAEAFLVWFAFRHEIAASRDCAMSVAQIEAHALIWARAHGEGLYAGAAAHIRAALDAPPPPPAAEATRAGLQLVIPGAEKRQAPAARQLDLLF